MILRCDCYNFHQDKLHGKGMRVHNYPCKSKTTGKYTAARCTVCGMMKEVSSA